MAAAIRTTSASPRQRPRARRRRPSAPRRPRRPSGARTERLDAISVTSAPRRSRLAAARRPCARTSGCRYSGRRRAARVSAGGHEYPLPGERARSRAEQLLAACEDRFRLDHPPEALPPSASSPSAGPTNSTPCYGAARRSPGSPGDPTSGRSSRAPPGQAPGARAQLRQNVVGKPEREPRQRIRGQRSDHESRRVQRCG